MVQYLHIVLIYFQLSPVCTSNSYTFDLFVLHIKIFAVFIIVLSFEQPHETKRLAAYLPSNFTLDLDHRDKSTPAHIYSTRKTDSFQTDQLAQANSTAGGRSFGEAPISYLVNRTDSNSCLFSAFNSDTGLSPSSSGFINGSVPADWRRFLLNKSRAARRDANIMTPRVTPTPRPILAPWLKPGDVVAVGDVVPVLVDVLLPAFVIEAAELEVAAAAAWLGSLKI
jgi:hypothetical protein